MPDDVEVIVKGLTDAEKQLVLRLTAHWQPSSAHIRAVSNRYGPNSLRGFGKSGLIDGIYRNPETRHRLTPLGLRVRKALQESEHGSPPSEMS